MNEFEFETFIKKLSDFHSKMVIKSEDWGYINYSHNQFKTIAEFREYFTKSGLLLKNRSGIYAFFINDLCIYIGKAKSIQGRLENHWNAANGFKNPTRGDKHRRLFKKYMESEFKIYYIHIEEFGKSKIGEAYRTTLEKLLQLKYNPEFEGMANKERSKKQKKIIQDI